MSRKSALSIQEDKTVDCSGAKQPRPRQSRKLVRRFRKVGEVSTRAYAIYNQCRHCRGWEGNGRSLESDVYACTDTDCPLWPYRCPKAVSDAHKSAHTTSQTKAIRGQGENLRTLPVQENRGKPGRKQSIQRFCAESCHCLRKRESRNPVRECQSQHCHLHPWRNGKWTPDSDS